MKSILRSMVASLQQNVAINKALITRGIAPAWCWSRAKCQEYWKATANSDANNPMSYASKNTAIVNLMDAFWTPYIKHSFSILELGCNCGVNLDALSKLHYSSLSGVEINKAAVDMIPHLFPNLVATIWTGSFEDVLPLLPSASSDVVFSMASLMHVHPSSHFIFGEIARVARKYVVTVEDEDESCGYVFPRDYCFVFEALGLEQVKELKVPKGELYANYEKYTMRLFRKQDRTVFGIEPKPIPNYKADFWRYDY